MPSIESSGPAPASSTTAWEATPLAATAPPDLPPMRFESSSLLGTLDADQPLHAQLSQADQGMEAQPQNTIQTHGTNAEEDDFDAQLKAAFELLSQEPTAETASNLLSRAPKELALLGADNSSGGERAASVSQSSQAGSSGLSPAGGRQRSVLEKARFSPYPGSRAQSRPASASSVSEQSSQPMSTGSRPELLKQRDRARSIGGTEYQAVEGLELKDGSFGGISDDQRILLPNHSAKGFRVKTGKLPEGETKNNMRALYSNIKDQKGAAKVFGISPTTFVKGKSKNFPDLINQKLSEGIKSGKVNMGSERLSAASIKGRQTMGVDRRKAAIERGMETLGEVGRSARSKKSAKTREKMKFADRPTSRGRESDVLTSREAGSIADLGPWSEGTRN